MSGLTTPITVLTAPYNVINNSKAISLDTQLTPQAIKEINQTPNYDVVSNPIKPKEIIRENFESTDLTKDTQQELVSDSLVDTALYDYLKSKDDYYDNKNQMVDNTIPYDPLKDMVKDYLKDNISMYDNRGKYFDQYLFNKKFDEYIELKNKERLLKEKVRLYDLNRIENIKVQPYELPLQKILINTKDTWFNIYDDLKNSKNPLVNLDINSFFYIGITLVTIVLLYVLLSTIFD